MEQLNSNIFISKEAHEILKGWIANSKSIYRRSKGRDLYDVLNDWLASLVGYIKKPLEWTDIYYTGNKTLNLVVKYRRISSSRIAIISVFNGHQNIDEDKRREQLEVKKRQSFMKNNKQQLNDNKRPITYTVSQLNESLAKYGLYFYKGEVYSFNEPVFNRHKQHKVFTRKLYSDF